MKGDSVTSKRCAKCGSFFSSEFEVCPYCGSVAGDNMAVSTKPKQSDAPARQEPTTSFESKSHFSRINTKTKAIVACLTAFAVVAASTVGYCVVKNKQQADEESKTNLFQNGLLAVKTDKWGVINYKGEWVVEPTLKNGGFAYTKNGAIIFEPTSESGEKIGIILPDQTVVYWTSESGLWGVKNSTGEYTIKPQFKDIKIPFDLDNTDEYEGLCDDYITVCSEDDLYGFADLRGNVVIEPTFDSVRQFVLETDKAYVTVDGKMGIIDRKGNYVIKPIYEKITMLYDGTYMYEKNSLCGMLDKDGAVMIAAKYKNLSMFAPCGLAAVRADNDEIGFINKSGEYVIQPQYRYAGMFDDYNVAMVSSDGDIVELINKSGEVLQSADNMKALEDGYYRIKVDDSYGIVDATGRVILSTEYDDISYDEDLGVFCTKNEDGKTRYFKKNGELAFPENYTNLKKQKNGMIKFKNAISLYGFMDSNFNVVVGAQYESARDFSDAGLALVEYTYSDPSEETMTTETRVAYIDEKGKRVIDPGNFKDGKSFAKDGHAWVYTDEGLWGQINKKGQFTVKPCIRGQVGRYQTGQGLNNGIYNFLDNTKGSKMIGFVNDKGIMIEAKFMDMPYDVYTDIKWNIKVYEFYDDGYAVAYGGQDFGVIDTSGDYVLPPDFTDFKRLVKGEY